METLEDDEPLSKKTNDVLIQTGGTLLGIGTLVLAAKAGEKIKDGINTLVNNTQNHKNKSNLKKK